MRITGGLARGIPLSVPSKGTRPATDKMRERVFSSLGPLERGTRFIDLYAGTGAYGLEAFSHGATSGVFVESGKAAIACIKQNLAAVEKSAQQHFETKILSQTVESLTRYQEKSFDILFADPPYAFWENKTFVREQLLPIIRVLTPILVVIELPHRTTLELPSYELKKHLASKSRGDPEAKIFINQQTQD